MPEEIKIYFMAPEGPQCVIGTTDHVLELIRRGFMIITKGDYEAALERQAKALEWLEQARTRDRKNDQMFFDEFKD